MSDSYQIRLARSPDASTIFELIEALAEYEKLSHQVTGSAELLREHLFGPQKYAEAIVVEWDGLIVGFALFFANYSTFLTQPGIYLEDLFVLPEYRRNGIGKAVLIYLAELAIERGAGRLEWSVLDWNASAIAFYETMGAKVLPDWRTCRVTGDSLANLAASRLENTQ
ncbi:MAG: GNAT family N-acetyltransferase [Prochloraceae cyanobacterium]|nr:GNAT family N-acetyltransferase [Prochloraceae cyanobacterium]